VKWKEQQQTITLLDFETLRKTKIVNKFSKRWSAHRGTLNKPDNRDDGDEMSSLWKYSAFHDIICEY